MGVLGRLSVMVLTAGLAIWTSGPRRASAAPLSRAEASAAFDALASLPEVPFHLASDGCYARAHVMARWLDRQAIDSRKIFVFGALRASTSFGDFSWKFHVAPLVQADVPLVLDPSAADYPLEVSEWLRRVSGGQDCLPTEVAFPGGFVPDDLDLEPCTFEIHEKYVYDSRLAKRDSWNPVDDVRAQAAFELLRKEAGEAR